MNVNGFIKDYKSLHLSYADINDAYQSSAKLIHRKADQNLVFLCISEVESSFSDSTYDLKGGIM